MYGMKYNARTILAGMIALAMMNIAAAQEINVAIVGALSGSVAQWGNMEFNGARQAIKDINAKGGIKSDTLQADKKDASDPYVWITYAAVQPPASAMGRNGSKEPTGLIKDLISHIGSPI